MVGRRAAHAFLAARQKKILHPAPWLFAQLITRSHSYSYNRPANPLGGCANCRYELAMKPKEIGMGEVLRTMEDWRIVECFEAAANRCPITGGCGLQVILKEALEAYFS